MRMVVLRRLRRLNARQAAIGAACLVMFAGIGYSIYMANRRLAVDRQTYRPLLSLIAQVESRGNYNAYFGNAGNDSIDFTAMPIKEVLAWQDRYVAEGSPSSAVGKYQFLNTTLEGLAKELKIDTTERFSEPMQDRLAVALLERRGSEAYVNGEITKNDFAANLAKEWASLPQIVGDTPEKSYYQSDGLNKALVEPDRVIRAVDHIRGE